MGRYEQVKPLMGRFYFSIRLYALSGAEMGYARESKSIAMLQFFSARKVCILVLAYGDYSITMSINQLECFLVSIWEIKAVNSIGKLLMTTPIQ